MNPVSAAVTLRNSVTTTISKSARVVMPFIAAAICLGAVPGGFGAASAAVVDQFQYSIANSSGTGGFGTTSTSPHQSFIGQSFTAGLDGLLTRIDLLASSGAPGSNDITFEIRSGDGTGGSVLGSLTETVTRETIPSLPVPTFGVSFDLTSLAIASVTGDQYTFLLTECSGSGPLCGGFLTDSTGNPYTSGQAYSISLLADADMVFQTHVSAVPIPAALPLFASALAGLGLLGWRKRKAQAA